MKVVNRDVVPVHDYFGDGVIGNYVALVPHLDAGRHRRGTRPYQSCARGLGLPDFPLKVATLA